ncbi:transducin/WD40 repeat-like superfamily protein [Striga asiatica]|uniref:Transducin/WD40 repeat-like superfamily protein n=1 Tax=Striga asiatica TaxID=4170 RepID=A0A5A7PFQ9_STRAF|nr:transducin/WD40 repeat-like superfamily protein [Striga asiatica]
MDRTSRFQNPLPLTSGGLAKPPSIQGDGVGMKPLPPQILDRFRAMVKEREEKLRVFNGGVVLPLSTDEIVRIYEIVLSELTINSKPIITDLTIIAGEQRAHGEGIADAICARIIEVPVDQKLPSLYLLDSIVKNIGKEYSKYFACRLPEVFAEAYAQVHPSMHQAMRHLFGTWSTVFPLSVLQKIEAQLQLSPSVNGQPSVSSSSKASGSPRPPHGIHINPKYFEAQNQYGRSTEDTFGTEGVSLTGRDLTTSSLHAVKKSMPPNTKLVKSSSPFRIGHAGSLSPSVEDFNADNSPKRTSEYGPYNGIRRDEELRKGDWQPVNHSQKLRTSTAYNYSSGLDLRGPRALISAYGMDEREKKPNRNHDKPEQLDMNDAEHSVSLRPWQNTEEEEFDWEDVTPALADRRQSNNAYSSLASSGNLSTRHGFMANHAARLVSDYGGNISKAQSASTTNSSIPEDVLSITNGHDKVAGVLQNVAIPNDMASQITPNFTRESLTFLAQSHLNANEVRLLPETRSFSTAGLQKPFPNMDLTYNPTYSSSAPEVRVVESSALTKPWNPSTSQNSHIMPSLPSIPPHMQIRGQFGTHNAFADQIRTDQLLGNTGSTSQFPNFRPMPIPVNLQNTARPPLLQPNPSQNLSLPLVPMPSSTMARPYAHVYLAQPQGPSIGNTSSNLVQGTQSSFPIPNMPFHAPRGPFHNTNQFLPVGQNVGQVAPTRTGGGTPFSGLISSLVAQGLISLPKQDSVGVDFDQDALKIRHEPTITSLYGDLPRQCTTCGLRFRTQDEHRKHMDWHVSKNRTLKNRKSMPSPKWYVSVSLWLSGAEALGPEPGPGFLPVEKAVEKVDQEEVAVPAEEDQNACALCGEPFDDFYSDETEEWMYRGAIYLYGPSSGPLVGMDRSQLGPIVHAKCRSDSHERFSEDVKDEGNLQEAAIKLCTCRKLLDPVEKLHPSLDMAPTAAATMAAREDDRLKSKTAPTGCARRRPVELGNGSDWLCEMPMTDERLYLPFDLTESAPSILTGWPPERFSVQKPLIELDNRRRGDWSGGGGRKIKDARTMWKEIREREFGKLRPNLFSTRVSKSRVSSIQLSNYKEIVSAHRGSINSLQVLFELLLAFSFPINIFQGFSPSRMERRFHLEKCCFLLIMGVTFFCWTRMQGKVIVDAYQVDLTEGRYLLAGASDATAAVYDIQRATSYEGRGLIAKHNSLFNINKQHEHGHKYAISSAIWYPIDTGLFVTGSYDHHINVWDTNTTQVVMNFKMPGKVYRTAMSSIARTHMLIAAGTEDVQVRLCDIASGAFAHTLSGHRDGVMSIEWSTSSEWVLATGGCDGAIRFWDIRRAGCFRVLDQSHSQFGRRPPVLLRPTANKKSSASSSSSVKVRVPQRKLANGNSSKSHGIGKISSQVKLAKQRSHPGMLSSHDRATGHYGVVTGLKMTEDGMYLLSSGSDSRLRLWDIESGCNTLVNFETTRLQQSKQIQMAVSQDSTIAFVPCMNTLKAFDIWSGQTKWTFRGHYENVNCCWYNALDQDLYTGGNDRQILVWSPSKFISEEDEYKTEQDGSVDQDNWSD